MSILHNTRPPKTRYSPTSSAHAGTAQPDHALAASGAATAARSLAGPWDASPVLLPAPRNESGMPLMEALRLRHSTREYSARELPVQTLSDLLWGAFGVNRPSADRTVPYWRHVMVIDLYVALAQGTWRYEAEGHQLIAHKPGDLRARTGTQDFVGKAGLDLIYVAHGERMSELPVEQRRLYASVDAAFIGQNVYLCCAALGLGTVFRGALDTADLAHALELPKDQFVTFAQTVGYQP